MNRKERNDLIADLYRGGWTQADLADRFHLSEPRIGQILNRVGLRKDDRPRIESERNIYAGVLLSKPVKEMVRQLAKEDKVSISKWIADAIDHEIKNRGITVHDPILDKIVLPQLPFEEDTV